jgi:hypothetical protein
VNKIQKRIFVPQEQKDDRKEYNYIVRGLTAFALSVTAFNELEPVPVAHTFQAFILEVPGSNTCMDTGYPHRSSHGSQFT